MARPRRKGLWLPVAFATVALVVGIRQGWVPFRLLPAIDLAEPSPWLLDLRLSDLRHSRPLCATVVKSPVIDAKPVEDKPVFDGCGWVNAVRISSVGGARAPFAQVACPVAAGLAMWMAHAVQPAAERRFGSRVTSLRHFGSYACRNIAGDKLFAEFRSEHATANAVDIAAFNLADGRTVSVAKHWKGEGKEAKFLREVRDAACRYFHVVLSPDHNQAHHDHFHLDRGPLWSCE